MSLHDNELNGDLRYNNPVQHLHWLTWMSICKLAHSHAIHQTAELVFVEMADALRWQQFNVSNLLLWWSLEENMCFDLTISCSSVLGSDFASALASYRVPAGMQLAIELVKVLSNALVSRPLQRLDSVSQALFYHAYDLRGSLKAPLRLQLGPKKG